MRALNGAGETRAAAEIASAYAKDSEGGDDALIWSLEEGALRRADGDIEKSVGAFKRAQASVERFEAEPETRLLRETESVLINQAAVPYKGYAYDKIMMSVYQALNYIELKKFDDAAVELKRLEFRQKDAERANISDIEKREKALAQAKKKTSAASCDVSKSVSSPAVAAALKRVYGDAYVPDASRAAKAVYVNPFAYWVAGLYFANRPLDLADKNRAADMFRLGGELLGGKSRVFAEDFEMAENLANGKIGKISGLTYVVYEAGAAPVRNQFKLDLPLYIVAKHVPHVSVNFPYLVFSKTCPPDISVRAGGEACAFETLADMDAIVKAEFDSNLPLVITKTVVSAAVKAGAQYAAARAAGDGWGGLAVNIAGSVYQTLTNDADLRTWTALPKRIKVARIKTPADGVVSVEGVNYKLLPARVNVIWVRRAGAGGKASARAFDFSDAPMSAAKS